MKHADALTLQAKHCFPFVVIAVQRPLVDIGSILESYLHTGKIAARQIVAKEGRKPARS